MKDLYYIIFKEKGTNDLWCLYSEEPKSDTPVFFHSEHEAIKFAEKLALDLGDVTFSYFKFGEHNKYIEIHVANSSNRLNESYFFIPYKDLKSQTKSIAHNHFLSSSMLFPNRHIQVRDRNLKVIYCWCDICKPER